MNDDFIKSLWEQGKQKEPKMSSETLETLLKRSVRTGWSRLRLSVWTYAAISVVVLVFTILNIAAFVTDPPWLAAHVAITAVTLACLVICARVLRELKTLDDPTQALTVLLKRQLRFFHTVFEWWLWVMAITVWTLSFSVSVWVENLRGHYRINQVIEFVAVSAALIFGTYALSRVLYRPMVQRTLAALHDLEAQIAEQTRKVAAVRKYWIAATVILVLALVASVIWGILTWLSATP